MSTRLFAALASFSSVTLGFGCSHAQGAAIAFDDASNSLYATTWAAGQNGGSGFGPWAMSFSGSSGAFVASSAANGDGTGNIDTGGLSWGLFARDPFTLAEAIRPFTAGGVTGDSTLGIGEQFILKFDNGFVDNSGAVGFGLRNAAGENRFEFFFQGSLNTYTLNIADNVQTVHQETGGGMTIKFTLTGPDTFQLDIAYAVGVPATETFTGTLEGAPGSGIDRFRLFNFAAGVGGKNVFYNSVQVVPEPSSAVLLAAGVLLGVARRRRTWISGAA
jgi:hypothetical protein